ncbi:MAG: TetR/AcrR family transcriptional regulator [Treponema sp.]|nr:TetR/AcrR family transcriptional regulator [Treponema sp.]
MENDSDGRTTRQKILDSAIRLFAEKGYTETSVRELAAAAGIKEASVYNHFPSKNIILEEILEEYSQFTNTVLNKDKLTAIKKNPSAEGILSSMTLVFPEGKERYYLKMLYVILQEQHRNPVVKKFVAEHYILANEMVVRNMIEDLKELGILRKDTDPDFWVKVHSSLLYAFAGRHMLGIGDNAQDYSGMDMPEILRNLYDMLLKTHGA